MLDNLGIRVKIDSLPTYPYYQHEKQRKYGTNWLSRIWCGHLRPCLLPEKQQAIDSSWEEAQGHLRLDLLNEVLHLGAEMVGDA